MQKAKFNKATGAYEHSAKPAQAGSDTPKAPDPAPAASSKRQEGPLDGVRHDDDGIGDEGE